VLGVLAVVLGALVLSAEPALAHKLNVYAGAAGGTITGYAYFPGGGRAKGVKVEVLGPDGKVLGQTETDQDGEFAFEAGFKCDHTFVVDSGDGHRATYTVGADELPDGLASLESTGQPSGQAVTTVSSEQSVVSPVPRPTTYYSLLTERSPGAEPDTAARHTSSSPCVAGFAEQGEGGQALGRQIRGLREQMEGYEEKTRFRDVLGGIGYIVGVAGIAFYFLGRRQQRRQ
jgi:nickel transport protein